MRRLLEALRDAIHAFRVSWEHARGRKQHVCSYHDLHITTRTIPRTRLTDLPGELRVTCTRSNGWSLWLSGRSKDVCLAGEYAGPGRGIRLDVCGAIIVDSMGGNEYAEETTLEGESAGATSRAAENERIAAAIGLPQAAARYEDFVGTTAVPGRAAGAAKAE